MTLHSEDYLTANVYYSQQFTVRLEARQNHWYTQYFTDSLTASGTNQNWLARGPGFIRHRVEYYANGRYCAQFGEISNTTTTPQLATYINADLWPWCNNGQGVNVRISLDQWGWAAFSHNNDPAHYPAYWYPNHGGNPGVRPITSHCRCP